MSKKKMTESVEMSGEVMDSRRQRENLLERTEHPAPRRCTSPSYGLQLVTKVEAHHHPTGRTNPDSPSIVSARLLREPLTPPGFACGVKTTEAQTHISTPVKRKHTRAGAGDGSVSSAFKGSCCQREQLCIL